jgi:nicotinic acid phosphoribosyltransferase
MAGFELHSNEKFVILFFNAGNLFKQNTMFEGRHHDVLGEYCNVGIITVTSKHNSLFIVIKATEFNTRHSLHRRKTPVKTPGKAPEKPRTRHPAVTAYSPDNKSWFI